MTEHTTHEKILAAARKIFVEHGFAGASMGKIAKLAEVNHSLIFHHFGNKEKLWSAVKHSMAREREPDKKSKLLPDTAQPYKDFLQELFSNCIRFYRNNPDIVRMINWQRLEYDKQQNIGITVSTESQAWLVAFKHYQQEGDINVTLKVEFILTLILSIVSSAALDQNVFIGNNKTQKAYIEFCVSSLQKALS